MPPTTRRFARTARPAPEPEEEEEKAPAPPRRAFKPAVPALRSKAAPVRSSRRAVAEDADDEVDTGISNAGWGAYKRTKESLPSKYGKRYKIPEDGEHLIKFLEGGPFVSFGQHWCEWLGNGKRLSYRCIADQGKNCPICEIGQSPSARVQFNILDLDSGEPVLYFLEVGITVADTINKYAQDKKVGPLDREDLYFAVQMTGGKNKKTTQIRPVKARDVQEDFDFEPLSAEELAAFDSKLLDETSADKDSLKELQAVADAYDD
jgi:hypothetical protein